MPLCTRQLPINRASYSASGGSGLTDLSLIFKTVNYDARTNGTTPTDTGGVYWDTPVIDGTNLWSGHKTVDHTLASSGGHGPYGDEWSHQGLSTPLNLAVGDEFWYAQAMWVDPSFNYTAGSNLKWRRSANVRLADHTTNVGWLDYYITDNTGSMKEQNEFAAGTISCDFNAQADSAMATLNYKFPKGTWVVLQHYIKFNTAAGIVRMWADNTPIYERTTERTMVNSSDTVVANYWQNYWNGAGLPAGNVGLHMRSSVTGWAVKTSGRDDTSFLATDSRGNKYIKMV